MRATRATDPLIRIAAGRVLRRVQWSGDAAVEVAAMLQDLRHLWKVGIEQHNFLPSPEMHTRLMGMLNSFSEAKPPHPEPIAWAIRCLDEGALDPTLAAEQMTAIESARMLLKSPPAENDRILPYGLELLPPPYLSVVVTALFARTRDETFTDNRSEMGFENELVPLNELRGRFFPDIDALFAVYLTFSGLVLTQWLGWLAENEGEDPGWVPYSHLMISWQLASVASWVGLSALLAFLDRTLHGADARKQFIALTFTELLIRIGRAGGRLKGYGGGSIASDVVEPGRFTDLTLYEGTLYAASDRDSAHKLTDSDALLAGRSYTLEVAIRRKRSGVGAHQMADFAVLNPREATETLSILVVATMIYGPLAVENTVARLSWPHDQDSTPTFIRLRPGRLDQPSMRAQVEIRLYHSNLDLLDVIRLTVSVATDAHAGSSGSEVCWFRDATAQPRLDPDVAIRAVNINVRPAEGGYVFTFLFLRGAQKAVLSFTRFIGEGDLHALLRRVRNFWTKLAITTYADKLTVTKSTWRCHLAELRQIGVGSWTLPFGDAEGDGRGAPEEVGDLLRVLDIGQGTHVQVNYDESVANFVFPWSLLYPPEDTDSVDPGRFWGARFQIEQVWQGRSENHLDAEPVDIAVAIDSRFGQSDAEEAMFADFVARAAGRLSLRDRPTDLATLRTALQGDPASHLYYFFCHGYAPSGFSVLRPDGVQMLEKAIAEAPEESKVRWQTLLTLTARMKDEAWIFLGDSEVTEGVLQMTRGFFRTRRPVVFMNMCHSAALLPSMTSGLVRLFLRRSASAVIGTEAPMTSVFAHAFAEQFFANLLAGSDIGTALMRARLYFLAEDYRNLLGLAYTLYGRATVAVCREAVVPLRTDTGTSTVAATD